MKTKALLLVTFAALFSDARVINLSEEKFASYFSLESGTSMIKTTPYDQNIASVDSYSKEYKTNQGGEFGFVYSSPYVAWRFSFEILKPAKLKEVEALAGTSALYLVESDITAVAPKMGIEIHLNRKPNYRFYAYGFYGSSNLTMSTIYTQVAAPNSDHTIDVKAASAETGGGLGFEVSFVDTTALIIELGYRSLVFSTMKYSKAVTTFQGAKAVGDTLTNLNGEAKSLNFSGYTASVGFRFWL